MMVADVAEFSIVWTNEFEHNPIGLIYPKAPYFLLFGMQLFGSERRVEGIAFEKICFSGCCLLNGSGQFFKEPIKRGGRRNLDHYHLIDQLG